MNAQEDPHDAAFVAQLVRDDALEGHDVRTRTATATASPEKPVEVDAEDDVGPQRTPRDARVVEPSVQRVEPGARHQRMEVHVMAERTEAAREPVEPDEGAATFGGTRRGGTEDGKPQGYRP